MWSVNDPLADRQYTKELLVKCQDRSVSLDHQCSGVTPGIHAACKPMLCWLVC